MSEIDLAKRLSDYVHSFGDGKRITAIHLFGIEFGHSLQHLSVSACKSLALKAGFKESLGTELHKGIRLSDFAIRK
jgi:hypothetical protein